MPALNFPDGLVLIGTHSGTHCMIFSGMRILKKLIYIKAWPSLPEKDLEIFKSLMHELDYEMVTVHFPDE